MFSLLIYHELKHLIRISDDLGNPIGGLVFSSAFGPLQEIFEWTVCRSTPVGGVLLIFLGNFVLVFDRTLSPIPNSVSGLANLDLELQNCVNTYMM